jgi:hypothetical protein
MQVKEARMSQMAPSGVGDTQQRRSVAPGLQRRHGGASGLASLLTLPRVSIGVAVAIEMVLLLIALVPATEWSRLGLPADGPIPHSLSWLVAGLFYILPALTGALCRRWQVAVVLAALPALVDLGVYAVATAGRNGPFYLAQDAHTPYSIGTLELFAVLGALGWLARTAILLFLDDRRQQQETTH